ncbi:MAG: diphthamide synthesis protein [archaeon]
MKTMYEPETDRIAEKIEKSRAKLVCLQFPDGLKQDATEIAEKIEKKTGAKCFIWLGSCFGACDLPLHLENLNFDMIVQFGHSEWKY